MTEEIKKNTLTLDGHKKEAMKPEKKSRRSKLDEVDEFYVDPSEIPDGFIVEWKRYQTYGKQDTPHLNSLSRDGWEPASPKDFPSLVGKYHKGEMILGGNQQDLILMIRPRELTLEAINEEKIKANQQVRSKMEEIGLAKTGEAPRTDSAGRSLAKVNRSYERVPVE